MNQAQVIDNAKAKSLLDDIERILYEFLNPERDPGQMRKREQILKAATDLFVAHGYRKTSMEEVAMAAGVAKGTLYLYYKNKAELLFHAVAFQNKQYMHEIAAALNPALSSRDQLRQMLLLSITRSRNAPLMARLTSGDREIMLVFQEIDDDTLSRVSAMEIDFITRMIDAATGGRLAPTVLAKRAQVLLSVMYAITISDQWLPPAMSLDDYAENVTDMLVNGLAS